MALNPKTLSQEQLAILASTPVIPPPNGTTSNFTNPETRVQLQLVITSVLLALSLAFYLNRVYVKICLMNRVSWDDATLLVGVLLSVTYYVACTWAIQKGHMARHLWDINRLQALSPNLLVTTYLMFVLPPIVLVFLKASFFILYLHLFESLRWVRICSWIGLCCITIIHVVLGVYSFTVASPYRADTWEHKALEVGVPASLLGLIVDVYILVIPTIAISRLNMSRMRKIGTLLIFLSGVLACGCSACSIYFRYALKNEKDKTWTDVLVNIATLSEILVGIMCACAPSASFGAKHPNSIYRIVLRKIIPDYRALCWSWNVTGVNSGFSMREVRRGSIDDGLKSTDRKYMRFFTMENLSQALSTPRDPFVSIPNMIHVKSTLELGSLG